MTELVKAGIDRLSYLIDNCYRHYMATHDAPHSQIVAARQLRDEIIAAGGNPPELPDFMKETT